MKFSNFTIKTSAFLCSSILLVLSLFGCSSSTKEKNINNKTRILYEDVAEVSIFKKDYDQLIQLPLILNKKTDNIAVENYDGENFNKDAIDFKCVLDSSIDDEQYCYILTLSFNANELLKNDKNAIIDTIDLKIDNEHFKYKFGTAELINKTLSNEGTDIQYKSLATGYEILSTIHCSFTANKAVTIDSINSTNNITFSNQDEYTGNLKEDSFRDCDLIIESPENYDKLYYCFDLFVNYKSGDQDKTFYYDTMDIQTSIKNRFPIYVDLQKESK